MFFYVLILDLRFLIFHPQFTIHSFHTVSRNISDIPRF